MDDAINTIEVEPNGPAAHTHAVKSMNAIKARLAKLESKFNLLDKKQAVVHLAGLQDRINELGVRLAREILKTTVLSEVSRIYADDMAALILALDNPVEWWDRGKNLTIRGWHEYLRKPQSLPHEYVEDPESTGED